MLKFLAMLSQIETFALAVVLAAGLDCVQDNAAALEVLYVVNKEPHRAAAIVYLLSFSNFMG